MNNWGQSEKIKDNQGHKWTIRNIQEYILTFKDILGHSRTFWTMQLYNCTRRNSRVQHYAQLTTAATAPAVAAAGDNQVQQGTTKDIQGHSGIFLDGHSWTFLNMQL